MSSLAPSSSISDSESPAPWTGIDPDELAFLALPPAWTFSLAEQAWIEAKKLGGLGLALDDMAEAGLVEHRSILDALDWTLTVQPQAQLRQILEPNGKRLLQARAEALRIGLMAAEEADALTAIAPGELSTQLFSLRLPDVQLRSRGFRFRDTTGLRVSQRVEVTFVRDDGEHNQSILVRGTVVATRGDNWSGGSAVVIFDSAASLRGEFPANHIYARFNVQPHLRKHLIDYLRQKGVALSRHAISLSRHFLSSETASVLDQPLQRWALLAQRSENGGDASARMLDATLKPCFATGQTSEAEAWLAAAQLLALAIGGSLETAVLLGQRRLEWSYRRIVDQHLLDSFVPRGELIEAFEELLHEARGPWALHFLGVGGVGKTMLMRHLTSTLGEKLPVSRVDFDFLSPDYPVRRPGQLLLELADGLRAFGGDYSDDLFQKFQDNVTALHAVLEASPSTGDELAAIDDHPKFNQTLGLFCDFLHALLAHPNRPLAEPRIVLILDTCEELARLRADGECHPAVTATFMILEQVHQRVNNVRVVFAGRRLLATRGADWEAKGFAFNIHPEEKKRQRPPPDYLRLRLVRGFTRREALQLLLRLKVPKQETKRRPMSIALAREILRASPETPLTVKISRAQSTVDTPVCRYNPFQLGLYADWFLEEPSLTPATIASGKTDPYVEKRIIGRLHHPELLSTLPHLVLLRRTDERLLRRILGRVNDSAFQVIFRELCQLEWMDYSSAVAGDFQQFYLEVERRLRPRIERCLRAERSGAIAIAAAQADLAPLLREAVINPEGTGVLPTSQLAVEHLEAALRLLPAEEAARIWLWVEIRVTQEEAWSWVRQVCERLLATEEIEGLPDAFNTESSTVVPPCVRDHVRLTHLSAMRRLDPGRFELRGTLGGHNAIAGNAPTFLRPWISERYRINQVAANARMSYASEGGTFVELGECLKGFALPLDLPERDFLARQRAVTLLAAVDSVLEMAENGFAPFLGYCGFSDLPEIEDLPPAMNRAFWLARTRWRRLHPEADRTRPLENPQPPDNVPPSETSEAEDAAPSELLDEVDEWLDWPITDATRTRWLFETARELSLANSRDSLQRIVERELGWLAKGGLLITSADGDALAAFLHKWQLEEQAPIPRTALEALSTTPGVFEPWIPTRVSHRKTAPFFVVLAEAWLALGEAQRALQLLYEGTSRQADPSAVRFAEAMRLRIVRRMRLENEALELVTRTCNSEEPDEFFLGWSVARLVQGSTQPLLVKREKTENEKCVCAVWRLQEFLTREGRAAAVREGHRLIATRPSTDGPNANRWARESDLSADERETRLYLELAAVEFALLAQQEKKGVIDFELEYGRVLFLRTVARRARGESAPSFHSSWRARLLLTAYAGGELNADSLQGEAGVRAAGNWALDEGELLALRWPTAGAQLLDFALQCFLASGEDDLPSAFIAALCGVIARIHARQMDEAVTRLLQLQPIYEQLCQQRGAPGGSLAGRRHEEFWIQSARPTNWERLLKSRGQAGDFFLRSVENGPQDWAPWLTRLQHCLEYCRASLAEPVEFAPWIQQAKGTSATHPEGERAPLELRLWFEPPVPKPQSLVTPQNADPIPTRRIPTPDNRVPVEPLPEEKSTSFVRKILYAAQIVVTVGFGGLLILSPIYAVRFVLKVGSQGPTDSTLWHGTEWIYALIGWVIIVGLVVAALSGFRAILALRSELLLSIRWGTRVIVELQHVKQFQRAFDFLLPQVWFRPKLFSVRKQGEWNGTLEPAAQENALSEISTELRLWAKWLVTRTIALAITTDHASAEIAWEERLLPYFATSTYSKRNNPSKLWRNFYPYRWLPDISGTNRSPVKDRDAIFHLSSSRWQETLEASWNGSSLRSKGVLSDWFQIEKLDEWPQRVRVLHFVGRPVDATAGIALKIEVLTEFTQYVSNLSRNIGQKGDEVLITPGRRGLESIPLIIVQAEPATTLDFTASARKEHERLRGFCEQIFTAGACAVLMLPSLAPKLAASVIELIARKIGKENQLGLPELLPLSNEVRTAISNWRPSPSVAAAIESTPGSLSPEQIDTNRQLDLALNVTLFARSTFKHISTNANVA